MTSHIRHRRLYDPAASFGPIEPGELAVNTANRQIVLGDQTSGTPLKMLAVRLFSTTAQYATGDLVVQAGVLYRASAAIPPGPWNAAQWTLISADTSVLVLKAGDTMTGPLILSSSSPSSSLEAASKAYIDAGDAAVTTAFHNADATKVNLSGDLMHGILTLSADPVNALDAATKQYVDTHAVTGPPSLPEAPQDGKLYGRMNAAWSQALPITGGTITTSLTMGAGATLTLAADPATALQSATRQYVDAQVAAVPRPPADAPSDGYFYGRVNGGWASSGTMGSLHLNAGNCVIQQSGNNPSVCCWDVSQGWAAGMFAGAGQNLYFGGMDANGGYNGSWLAYLDSGGHLHLPGTGIVFNAYGGNTFAWKWDGSYIHGVVNGTDIGLLATTAWANSNFITSSNAVIGGNGIKFTALNPTNYQSFQYNGSGSENFYQNGSYVGSATLTPSDIALKSNIAPVAVDALGVIRKIVMHAFDLKFPDGEITRHFDVGFIADELEQLIPQAIIPPPEGVAGGFKCLDVVPIVAYCVRAIQQLAEEIQRLKKE
jgi:hypothetical protein